MERTSRTCTTVRSDVRWTFQWLSTLLVALIFFSTNASAQLSGTYTIGGVGGNYSTIADALNALNSSGVNGPVTFLIADGTINAPSGGFWLQSVSGMNATNTVTFKPDANATVLITASQSYGAIFRIYDGDYFIIDGSNSSGGTSRDMTIRNTSTSYGSAVWMDYDANNNVVRNCVLQSNSPYYSNSSGGATVLIGRNAYRSYGGNDSNLVENCKIGDDSGTYRAGVAVHLYGGSSSTSYRNYGNMIVGNDIVNFGKMYSTNYYQGYSYGVRVDYYNNGTIIRGNDIHITQPLEYYYCYGIYVYEYYGYSANTVIDGNRIHDLQSNHSYSYLYHLYYYGYRCSNSTPMITNNMISMGVESNAYYYGMYIYARYGYSTNTVNVYNNSIYSGGSASSRSTYMFYLYGYGSSSTVNFKNNILYSDRSGGSTSYGIYNYYITSNWNSDYNLIDVQASSAWRTAYYNFSTYSSLSSYRNASGDEQHSVQGDPSFLDPGNGDLHVDTVRVSPIESRGITISGVTTDCDGQTRSTFAPDIGADEGNFNGGGIQVLYPNGGEEVTVDYLMTARYSTNRPMGVKIDLSTDGGASWINYGIVDPTNVGNNEFTLTTPNVETDHALIRVISNANPNEADTSNREFRLVRPVLTVTSPNGGEQWVPTDTNRIQWTSIYVPSALTVSLDYSTDAGATWLPIASGLSSPNMPAVNTYNWIVPNAPGVQTLVRVKMDGSSINDASDDLFTILPQPFVKLTYPRGGEKWYSGEKQTIRWTSITTDYVRLDYSTDEGQSWTQLIERVPAYIGAFDWTPPEGMSANALIRVTNVERPRFYDMTDDPVHILTGDLTVLSPNGGETYELKQQITVAWASQNAKTLQLDYSINNGLTWTMISDAIPADDGLFAFTPPEVPTKLALVRLVDVDRQNVSDRSDKPFEILRSKSISVLAPGQGDQLLRNSTTTILWDAPRISNINLFYSSDGGARWSVVASNVNADLGSFTWTTPNTLTDKGMIRITEVGGAIEATSGTFAIVNEPVSTLRVITPNGGETYTEGDPIMIRWTASSDLLKVAASYSMDNGATWMLIAKNLPANVGSYDWIAPAQPGIEYLVKVEAANVSDVSDNTFTVQRRLAPMITLISPNGGETFTAGDTMTVTWAAQDITGTVDLSYSMDSGATWTPIATMAVSPASYDWTIPNEAVSDMLWMKIAATDGSASDQSDAAMSVEEPTPEPIRIITPNTGAEVWVENSTEMITWEAPSDISQIDLHYSTDGGATWTFIASSASSAGTNSYSWTIPQIIPETHNALVKATASDDTARFDVSDNPFTLKPSTLGVPTAVAGVTGMKALGGFPNPFTETTQLRWTQSTSGDVMIRLFDASGRIVRETNLGRREAGRQQFDINGNDLSSGAYIYEVRTGSQSARGMVVLAR